MAIEVKVRKIGNSYGVVLPKEALNHLKVEEGQSLYLTEAPEGTYNIHASDPHFAQAMEAFSSISKRYRNTLKELAK